MVLLLILAAGRRLKDITYSLYSVGLYIKQHRVPVASDCRGRDSSLFSTRSLEDRRQRPTLLLHINRRKVEAFIHSVIIFHWHLSLPQLGTSNFIIDNFCRIRLNSDVRFGRVYCWPRKGPKQDFGVSSVQGLFVCCCSYHSSGFQFFTNASDISWRPVIHS